MLLLITLIVFGLIVSFAVFYIFCAFIIGLISFLIALPAIVVSWIL